MLNTYSAIKLYHNYASDMPIADYHCHINPKEIYDKNPRVKTVVDMLKKGFAGESFADIAEYLIGVGRPDPYMCLIDFDSYIDAHYKMDELYKDQMEWHKKSCINIARSGFFAADRSIEEYADNIWNLNRVE